MEIEGVVGVVLMHADGRVLVQRGADHQLVVHARAFHTAFDAQCELAAALGERVHLVMVTTGQRRHIVRGVGADTRIYLTITVGEGDDGLACVALERLVSDLEAGSVSALAS